MSKLIKFLEKMGAGGEILKELEKDPTTLRITNVDFVPQPSADTLEFLKML